MVVELRKVNKDDVLYIYNLRNNEKIRQMFFDNKPISKQTNQAYWEKRIKEDKPSYIIMKMGTPIGFVKLDYCDMEKSNYVGIIIHPYFQGRGYGKETLDELKKHHSNLKAKIKSNNEKSIKLFTKSGYKIRCIEFELSGDKI